MAVNTGAFDNFIGLGGSRANVISGNTGNGVSLTGYATDTNFVENDLIGIDAAGVASLGNGQDGVLVSGRASSNFIGFAVAGDNNVISGNKTWGVYITDDGTTFNTVANNFIGTNVTGTSAVPNANNGLDIVFGAQYNTVGGTTAAARNLISGNLNEGVLIGFAGTANNVVEGNFIGTDATGEKVLAKPAAARRGLRRPGGRQQHHRWTEPCRCLQHRRLERDLGQCGQRHPGHR